MAKMLIVRNDPDIMWLIVHTLNASGYQVVPAYDGEDALRKMKLHKFDLVLTDLSMPKVSGVEVIQEIKGDPATKDVPVVAVTAHVWDTLAQSAGKVGCDGYISKPFSSKQLLMEVRKHLKPAM